MTITQQAAADFLTFDGFGSDGRLEDVSYTQYDEPAGAIAFEIVGIKALVREMRDEATPILNSHEAARVVTVVHFLASALNGNEPKNRDRIMRGDGRTYRVNLNQLQTIGARYRFTVTRERP